MSYRQPVPVFHRDDVERERLVDSQALPLGAVVPGLAPHDRPVARPRGGSVSPGARRERDLDFALDAVFEPEDGER